eukprot:scaffold739_cov66-Cyclotella_meneghiniana.AAC.8
MSTNTGETQQRYWRSKEIVRNYTTTALNVKGELVLTLTSVQRSLSHSDQASQFMADEHLTTHPIPTYAHETTAHHL